MKCKLIRIATVPHSFGLLRGQLKLVSNNNFEVIAVSSPGARLEQVAIQEGVQTIGIEMTRTISPIKDGKALWQLFKLFKREKPDMVHTHTPKAGTLGSIAARMAGVPYRLHTIAGLPLLEARGAKRKLLDLVEKATYSCATHLYPNSNGLKNIIVENKLTKESKLKVIGYGSSNGVDTSFFDPKLVTHDTRYQLRKSLGIDPKDFVFLFVGRLVADKGINELIQAFIDLEEHAQQQGGMVKPHLVLVGRHEKDLDPLSPEAENAINTHPSIHGVGVQFNVVDYYAMADVLTFPSYREGFPNVVMEAAAMQLNCIVTNINGCNEIITDAKNGWIIPIKNKEQLQDRMQWCFQNKNISAQMGLKSREIMQKNYERAFLQEELLKEYKNILLKN